MCCTRQPSIAVTHNVCTYVQPSTGLHIEQILICDLHYMLEVALPTYTYSPERTLAADSIHIWIISNIVLHVRKKMHHVVYECALTTINDSAVAYQHTRSNLTSTAHDVRCDVPTSCSYNYIFKVLFTTPSWYL